MFEVKKDKEIGEYLNSLILSKYPSVRQFGISYLRIREGYEPDDPTQIRNIQNRLSQIVNGNKSLQLYDLPIVSELLGVSCEELLSCGETRVPLAYRNTNYNIAFSKNEADWEGLLSREDCIAAYADEFGKTVLDYAIEAKNYEFIKYLIAKGYITLVSDRFDGNFLPNFGAESKIVERPIEHKTLEDEFYRDKLLRTRILSLAIENNDIDTLEKFKARQFPIQFGTNVFNLEFDFSEYSDEEFIKNIASSKTEIFDYFLEEYTTKTIGDKREITWIFPFLEELIKVCLMNGDYNKATKAIETVIQHNKKVYEQLRKKYLYIAKKLYDSHYALNFPKALKMVKSDYKIDRFKRFVSLFVYYLQDEEPLMFNIICVNHSIKDNSIQSKIDELNKIYNDVLDLPNHFIKNT